ncbi:phosphate signaling complex protein PhoU [Oscillibacter sp.]|uniref:phosphate signaling complex protein PhoU n=1 Tax=Oscillibacter sp. TaxID=1945593 RepID=UPI00257B51A1|nr:phosphate signaling complex protein PhoU [Oscillibacter sp.]
MLEARAVTAGTEDAQEVERLLEAAFPPYERPPFSFLTTQAEREEVSLLAYRDEGLFCGFAFMIEDARLAYVLFLAVGEGVRSKGYGARMLADIERRCLRLLLQQQPVARDLREISSALKMISDLERIGDQAADIAELTRFVRLPDGPGRQRIEEMSKAVIRMVTDSVDSFVKRDLELAREVCREDDQVDVLFNQVKKELIGLIAADADSGELWLDLIMVAKYLERIGDHATNVAEWVEYSITGNHPSNN